MVEDDLDIAPEEPSQYRDEPRPVRQMYQVRLYLLYLVDYLKNVREIILVREIAQLYPELVPSRLAYPPVFHVPYGLAQRQIVDPVLAVRENVRLELFIEAGRLADNGLDAAAPYRRDRERIRGDYRYFAHKLFVSLPTSLVKSFLLLLTELAAFFDIRLSAVGADILMMHPA